MGIKYKVNENFFKHWNSDMAYVLGFIFADGSMENAPYLRGKYLRIFNTDLEIIENIKNKLDSLHKIVRISLKTNPRPCYMLRIGSHKIYDDLGKLNVFPKKSLNMEMPAIPKKYFRDFLRGYFDGDGCVTIEKPKNILKIIFTSGSSKFLEKLSSLIQTNIHTKLHKTLESHRSFQIRFSQKEAIIILKYMYKDFEKKLFLKRKRNIYYQFMLSRSRSQAV